MLRQDSIDIVSFNRKSIIKNLLHELYTIHGNSAAINGADFLILDCLH